MSSYVNAGIVMGAIIPLKALDQFKSEKPALTHTEERFSQKTGRPVKPAVIVDEPAQIVYEFAPDYVMSMEVGDHLRELDLSVLAEFLGSSAELDEYQVTLLDNDEDTPMLCISKYLEDTSVDIDGSYMCLSLASEPFTELAALPALAKDINETIKNRLGLDVKVGLITALDVSD